jgi:hypothetical protein
MIAVQYHLKSSAVATALVLAAIGSLSGQVHAQTQEQKKENAQTKVAGPNQGSETSASPLAAPAPLRSTAVPEVVANDPQPQPDDTRPKPKLPPVE